MVTLPDAERAQYCKRVIHASLYENLFVDLFGQPGQLMPDNPDPSIHIRERQDTTTPKAGTGSLPQSYAFLNLAHEVVQVSDSENAPANMNTFTVDFLEAAVPEGGYCMNQNRVTVPQNERHGWQWDCDVFWRTPNNELAAYHPNGVYPSHFSMRAHSGAEYAYIAISLQFKGDIWEL